MFELLIVAVAAFVALLFTAPRPRTPERDAQADAEQEEQLIRAATRTRKRN